ncbi:S8 family peptidase [Planctobacterium marinum]|uniref:Peptidase S8/S53 domain-containing protein n=1 Tax=Planctobacterium marinum TaxID=1631968 RepID=A0AA48HG90_9ALTE|nr:hypothetical protein MACH26_19040 [Planctobacterium marinum]
MAFKKRLTGLAVLTALCQPVLAQIQSEQAFSRLLDGDSEKRVIVTLNVKAPPKGTSERIGGGQWLNLNQYIKAAQKKLATEMGWRNLNDVVNFEQVPAMAKSISLNEFRKLQESGTVASIHEDKFHRLSLDTSIRSIGSASSIILDSGESVDTKGEGVSIAVLDSGVDYQHPFFQGRVIAGACYSAYGSCDSGAVFEEGVSAARPCPVYGCDHGTHVAGIIAGNNGQMHGVAPKAEILALNVFSNDGVQMGAFDSDIIQGLEWVYQHAETYNVAAVNMSLGGGLQGEHCDDSPTKYIIDKLLEKDVLTVVASGNDGATDGVGTPSCISSAMSVGSMEKDGSIASYSNSYGQLDIVAPGSDINSSVPGGKYGVKSGTSMATPHVAGAVAVLKSAFPEATAAQIRRALKAGKSFRDPRNGVRSAMLHIPSSIHWLEENVIPVDESLPTAPLNPVPVPTEPEKEKCKKRIDGILVEKTTGDCAKEKKIQW